MTVGQSSSFTGLNITESFNTRLQPNEIKVSSTGGNALDLIYNSVDPVSGKNAGHVYGITNNLDTSRSQAFTYDQLNRITSAQTTSTYAMSPTHCWSEVYGLDPWANLQSISATTNSAYTGCSQESGFSCPVDGNNHMLGCSGAGYDASGNMTTDSVYGYSWNAESQLIYSSGGVHYNYDGQGRRASKSSGNEPKLYWYGSGGEILSETNPSSYLITDYVYFAGKRVAQVPNDLNLNGGFESGLQNWTASGSGTAVAVTNPANAHSGSSYVDIFTPANFTTTSLTTTQPIAAQKGETITATGWVYRESGVGYARWWLKVTGSNGTLQTHPADNFTMNTWIYQPLSITIPSWFQGPFTVTMWAEVDSQDTNQSTTARFDDATLNGNTLLFAEDSLGSTRVVTDTSGVVCYDADFYPYKFEGKERDVENGNDYFGARYYSNRFGRWLSADWSNVPVAVPYANLTNPQTLNLYAMVSDDPESFADLDGHIQGTSIEAGGVPTCASIGSAANGTTSTGCSNSSQSAQTAQQPQDQNQDQNQQSQQSQQQTNQNQDKNADQEKDKQQTPLDAGAGSKGGQGKGERGKTRTPENPGKHVKPVPGMPGRWQVKDPHTGKWKIKPPGWSPETAQRMILGAEVGATAYFIYRAVRMLPSFTPWTWETIPLNLATP